MNIFSPPEIEHTTNTRINVYMNKIIYTNNLYKFIHKTEMVIDDWVI